MRARAPRGQAVTELAIGSLVLVSLLLIGFYLTEVVYVGLKVHEAAAYSTYDAMGQRVYRMAPSSISELPRITSGGAGSPAGNAVARYQDFEGLSTGGSNVMTHVGAQASNLSVTCERAPGLDLTRSHPYRPISIFNGSDFDFQQATTDHWAQMATSAEYRRLLATLNQMHPAEGGVACHAQADVSAFGVPSNFLTGASGFFKADLLVRRLITVCSPGRGRNGSCPGSYALLLGDFSLATNPGFGSNSDCTLAGCSNPNYASMVQSLYDTNIGDTVTRLRYGSQLASQARGLSPIDETKFWMSFSGEEHGFMDGIFGGNVHNTSGASGQGAQTPTKWNGCFAGQPGC